MKPLTPEAAAALPRIREALWRLEQMPPSGDVAFGEHRKAVADLMQAISLDAALLGNFEGEPDSVIALGVLQRRALTATFPSDLRASMDLFVGQIHECLDLLDG